MSEEKAKLDGPDLAKGVALSTIADGTMLLGHAHGEPVLLARRGDELFAIGALCTHYGAPLSDGLLVGDAVRCPWHHAGFSLRTGEALRPPALNAVSCWRVERRDATVYVRERVKGKAQQSAPAAAGMPGAIVIVGGGAAGNAAAETLRREGYSGSIVMLSADEAGPYDRPNLSKGYLAGTASEDWIPLRSPDFYEEQRISLKLGAYLQTSVPGILAAGDIARWPDRLSGERIRVEHWVVAQRQGQTAARNMLGRRERFHAVPFFWTEQYDFSLSYVGHAERWDKAEIVGRLAERDCTITYRRGDKKLAVAVVHRDLEGLRAEVEFERTIAAVR